MEYPLPFELKCRITQALMNAGVYQLDDPDLIDRLHFQVARLIVRESRLLRQKISKLRRDLLSKVETEEEDYGSAVCSYAGEETCNYILDQILKPHIYFNTEESRKRKADVEKVIREIFKDDNS